MSLIKCPECEKEVSDKSEVCIHCGYPISKIKKAASVESESEKFQSSTEYPHSTPPEFPKEKKIINKAMIAVIAVVSVIAVIATIVVLIVANKDTSVDDYLTAFNAGDFSTANTLYNDRIASSENNKIELITQLSNTIDGIVSDFENGKRDYSNAKDEIIKYKDTGLVDDKISAALTNIEQKYSSQLENELETIKSNYFDKKLSYDEAKKSIDEIRIIGLINGKCSEVEDTINKDNLSNISYEDGIKYEKEKNYEKAIDRFSAVDSVNSNYDDAQKRIKDNQSLYETQILTDADELSKKHQYSDAISKINKAIDIIGETDNLTGKKSEIETAKEDYAKKINEENEKKEKERIENAKNNQEMIVTSVSVEGPGYINSNEVSVIVKNTTNKYTKSYKVCMLIFDSNGFPLVPSYNSSNIEYGTATKTIGPNETYGQNSYWDIFCPEKMYIKACVVSVDYQDGTTWENEYFSYWLSENKDQY